MRFLIWFALVLIVAGAIAVQGLKWFSSYIDAPGPLAQEQIIFIAPGTGTRAISEQLRYENVIDEPYAFLAALKILDMPSLKAGEYQMPAHVTLRDALTKISRGEVFARQVTIPEGLWSSEIAAIINNAEAMEGEIAVPPEGSVLPDTYAYIRGEDRARILKEAQDAMRETLDDLWSHRAPNLPFTTKEEAVILASIVEKETGVASERARIAGVFVNRLRKGMMLQSDPTVIYAVTNGESKLPRVLYEHLEVESPYNTYRQAGLPPGPICNPGRAAIAAVLQPEANDFLYFVADGSGGHVFSATLDEHNANVAKWRAHQRSGQRAQNRP